MEKHILTASPRTVLGRKVKSLRTKGVLPANIYGKKTNPTAIQVSTKDFSSLYDKVGETGLIEIQVDGVSHPVLVHSVEYDAIKGTLLHVDFYQVNLHEKVTAYVPLEVSGESPAEKDKAGVLLTQLTEVEVEALPGDLPEKIVVDVSALKQVDDSIHVSDLIAPQGVKIITPPEYEVVKIGDLVVEEAEEPPVAAPVEGDAEAAPVESVEGDAEAAKPE